MLSSSFFLLFAGTRQMGYNSKKGGTGISVFYKKGKVTRYFKITKLFRDNISTSVKKESHLTERAETNVRSANIFVDKLLQSAFFLSEYLIRYQWQ